MIFTVVGLKIQKVPLHKLIVDSAPLFFSQAVTRMPFVVGILHADAELYLFFEETAQGIPVLLVGGFLV